MGVELYITRAEFLADNKASPITENEWLSYIESDPELSLDTSQGDYFARWHGKSAYEEPWLDWFQGNISTKWPDTALYQKMLQIAHALGGNVQDDDGTVYQSSTDWQFDPHSAGGA
ncbi:hypothetical protein [Stenotrophomonas pigmentata]|uniref:hypothetical protein n=1 Tax=Stenotrophomonas pigmentata TaxID=3055080 RepID=UPI0026F1F828|nr:hypothetical protein [Stenotrophomonas sp. 610A2]